MEACIPSPSVTYNSTRLEKMAMTLSTASSISLPVGSIIVVLFFFLFCSLFHCPLFLASLELLVCNSLSAPVGISCIVHTDWNCPSFLLVLCYYYIWLLINVIDLLCWSYYGLNRVLKGILPQRNFWRLLEQHRLQTGSPPSLLVEAVNGWLTVLRELWDRFMTVMSNVIAASKWAEAF